MRIPRFPRRAVTIGATTAVLLVGAGIAAAAWLSPATVAAAEGNGHNWTAPSVTYEIVGQPSGGFLPGEKATVKVTLANPNDVKAAVVEVGDGTVVYADGTPDACKTAVQLADKATVAAVIPTLPAGRGIDNPVVRTVPDAVTFDGGPAGCAGVRFTAAWPVTFQPQR